MLVILGLFRTARTIWAKSNLTDRYLEDLSPDNTRD